MIIRKIKIENFRGFQDKFIDFQDKPVVLLSAANGMGKTTTIDAIEWCLTGGIGRLKTAFDTRSTNDADRKMNTDGILKNRNAGAKEKVKVSIWLFDGKTEHILCREQTRDELNPENSQVTLDQDSEAAETFIREYVGNSFYNFHFCDVQKSFNVQSKKRKDLVSFFDEFITNYDQQKQVAENLDVFAEDVNRYIEDKKNQMLSNDGIIEQLEERIEAARKAAGQISYPATRFYPGEKTEIFDLNEEQLTAQKRALVNCGYQIAEKGLSKIVTNETYKKQQLLMQEIVSHWNAKGAAIRRAVKFGFSKNTAPITDLEKKLQSLEELSLSKTTIFKDGESLLKLQITGFSQSDLDAAQKAVCERKKKLQALSDEIELLTKNNRMLRLLSSLCADKKAVVEYRNTMLRKNGAVQCPVCGSESFGSIEEDLILKEADAYINANGEVVQTKEEQKEYLYSEIDAIYQKVTDRIKDIVENGKKKLSTEISDLQHLWDVTQPYFEVVRKLQLLGNPIDAETLTAEKVQELLAAVERKLLESSEEQKVREEYQRILTVIGYKFEEETVQQTYEKVKHCIPIHYEVSDFSYGVFVTKLNSIDSILANQRLITLQQKRDADVKKNEKLEREIGDLSNLEHIASERAKDIRSIIETLSRDEYEKVGPSLSRFYNKLARSHSGGEIHIVQKNDGISLVDDKGKNIVNVLSNGQISIFMLAYFFAGINARNDREKMKVYFIDDLTACMDDVNMLAFMDLLKYQISSQETMKQLFFITCDDRISKLLKYKLNGRGIALRELTEADFV